VKRRRSLFRALKYSIYQEGSGGKNQQYSNHHLLSVTIHLQSLVMTYTILEDIVIMGIVMIAITTVCTGQ
jgi:hypothetical protein